MGPVPIPTWIKLTPSVIGESSLLCKSAVLNFVASREKDRPLVEKSEEETLLEILKHLTDVTANDIIVNTDICIIDKDASNSSRTSVGCELRR